MTSTYILGISSYYHDSAACLVRDGEIVAAAQEERFTRKKGDPSFPKHAVAFCVKQAGMTASGGVGRGAAIELQEEIHWPDSLGMLYSAFTYFTGFKVNSGEYKVMGLAPYGEPKYVDLIYQELIELREDGSFRMNQEYFDY